MQAVDRGFTTVLTMTFPTAQQFEAATALARASSGSTGSTPRCSPP